MKKANQKTISVEEFDRLAETGCDMTPYLDLTKIERPGHGGKRQGAGRKVCGREGRSIRLSVSTWKKIEHKAVRSKKSVSEVIESALSSIR